MPALTTTQVAALAGTSRFTVEREIRRGHLAAARAGRIWVIDEDEAERWASGFVPYAEQRGRRHRPNTADQSTSPSPIAANR